MIGKPISMLVGIVTGLANGLFGSGGGSLLVPAMQRYLGTQTHKSHATAIAVILPLSVVSIIVYVFSSEVPWLVVMWVSIGGLAGGLLGALLLNKFSSSWLHKFFGLFMIAAAIKMVI